MNFIAENKNETNRLRALAGRIGSNWATELGGGWTVGTMMCHLAFWDKMTQVRLNRWIQSGQLAPLPDMDNVHSVNDSVRAMSEQMPAEAGCKFAVLCADEIDQSGGIHGTRADPGVGNVRSRAVVQKAPPPQVAPGPD